MAGEDVAARMREDWNARAREDAGYYGAFEDAASRTTPNFSPPRPK